MRTARVFVNGLLAGHLEECPGQQSYRFSYQPDYCGPPVSLTMPLAQSVYEFTQFPPFFEGLLPEGALLEALLRKYKLDADDYFGQLLQVGQDLVGTVTVEALP